MPELPEIETVRMQLDKVLVGREILRLEVLKRKSVEGDESKVEGKKVVGVGRKGKMLEINLEQELVLAIHFKMTGQLVYEKKDKHQKEKGVKEGEADLHLDRVVGGHPTADFVGHLPSAHTRAVFYFDDGSKMFFNDQRLFGWIKILTRTEVGQMKFVENLGPEPFDLEVERFMSLVGKSKRPIKLVIMDQSVISGVGNIYANDALWEAKIDPRRGANTLTRQQYEKLLEKINLVLNEGILYGGATAADAKYIDLHGLGGHYQEHFRVYDRTDKECKRGDGKIVRFVLGGRGTYMCEKCQG